MKLKTKTSYTKKRT